MEDKTTLYENINIFSTSSFKLLPTSKTVQRPDAIYGVFDGHCGVDCAQYISTHLAMSIVQNPKLKSSKDSFDLINQLIFDSFQNINQQFTEKATKEVNINLY
jgi:serine/threonine protein phosphatase PrpC